MEEITIEVDDETVNWLELTAAATKRSISELVGEIIQERRESMRALRAALSQEPGPNNPD
jgi:predicted transcriptional regulator